MASSFEDRFTTNPVEWLKNWQPYYMRFLSLNDPVIVGLVSLIFVLGGLIGRLMMKNEQKDA